jgi:hypothetical protein
MADVFHESPQAKAGIKCGVILLNKYHAMKMQSMSSETELHAFLTPILNGGGQLHAPVDLTSGKSHSQSKVVSVYQHHAMEKYGGYIKLHALLTSAINGRAGK